MSQTSPTTPLAELISRFSGCPEHMAVVHDDIAALDAALQADDGDVNALLYVGGDSPLTLAIRLHRTNMVEHLINVGADLHAHGIFSLAAEYGNETTMALLLQANRDFVTPENIDSLYCDAARNPNGGVLATLLAGVPSNWPRPTDQALHFAAANENDQAISVLLAAGCNHEALDDDIAHFAAANRNEVGADLQLCNSRGARPIHVAAANPNAAVIRMLIANGVDVNVLDKDMQCPLLIACSNPNEEVLDALLAAGAAWRDCNSGTVCHAAAANSNEAIMRRVIDRGVDLSARNDSGRTPLHIAAAKSTAKVVSLLLAAGADVRETNFRFGNVMVCEYACANEKNAGILSVLLAAGASLPRAPLMIESAINASNIDALQTLIATGVDIVREFHASPRLMKIAARSHSVEMLEFLIRLGVSLGTFCETDGDGRTLFFVCSDECRAVLFAHGGNLTVDADWTQSSTFSVPDTFIAAGVDISRYSMLYQGNAMLAVAGHPRASMEQFSRRELAWACNRIAERQFELLRMRAFQVCVGLQSLRLPALVSCEILAHAFGARESLVPFHRVWAIVTKVKHFH